MSTDPSQIQLSPEQRRQLAELADRLGKPWSVVLGEAMAEYGPQAEKRMPGRSPVGFGSGKGLVTFAEDFNALLTDFRDYTE